MKEFDILKKEPFYERFNDLRNLQIAETKLKDTQIKNKILDLLYRNQILKTSGYHKIINNSKREKYLKGCIELYKNTPKKHQNLLKKFLEIVNSKSECSNQLFNNYINSKSENNKVAINSEKEEIVNFLKENFQTSTFWNRMVIKYFWIFDEVELEFHNSEIKFSDPVHFDGYKIKNLKDLIYIHFLFKSVELYDWWTDGLGSQVLLDLYKKFGYPSFKIDILRKIEQDSELEEEIIGILRSLRSYDEFKDLKKSKWNNFAEKFDMWYLDVKNLIFDYYDSDIIEAKAINIMNMVQPSKIYLENIEKFIEVLKGNSIKANGMKNEEIKELLSPSNEISLKEPSELFRVEIWEVFSKVSNISELKGKWEKQEILICNTPLKWWWKSWEPKVNFWDFFDDSWNRICGRLKDLSKTKNLFSERDKLDKSVRKDYLFFEVLFKIGNKQEKLYIDPQGYDYPRYIAKLNWQTFSILGKSLI